MTMRRATIILGLTSSAVAVAFVALVYGIGSHQSQSTDEPTPEKARQAQQASSIDTTSNETATTVVPYKPLGAAQDPTVRESDSDTDFVPPPGNSFSYYLFGYSLSILLGCVNQVHTKINPSAEKAHFVVNGQVIFPKVISSPLRDGWEICPQHNRTVPVKIGASRDRRRLNP